MRKILAGFMATSMIVAMASSVTFAAATPSRVRAQAVVSMSAPGSISNTPIVGVVPNSVDTPVADRNSFNMAVTYEAKLKFADGTLTFNLPAISYISNTGITLPATGTPCTAAKYAFDSIVPAGEDVAEALDGKDFSIDINGISYTGTVEYSNGTKQLTFLFDQAGAVDMSNATFTVTPTNFSVDLPTWTPDTNDTTYTYKDKLDSAGITSLGTQFTAPTFSVSATDGKGVSYAEEDRSGNFKTEGLHVNDVVWCDGSGNPMVFTEKLSAADEDQNGADGVQTSKTLYFLIRDDAECKIDKLEDDTFWKIKVTKGDNGKYIKAISDVTKNFSDGLYPLNSKGSTFAQTKGRHRYIKVELNELFTDDEYKLTLDMRLSAKSKAVNANVKIGNTTVSDSDEIKINDFSFYIKNLVKDADNDWKVGISGLMLSPLSNDWNDVTWFDEDGDVAHMKFFADSDVDKFYSKLSTKWEHADYASYFNDQDAYIFDFVGSPKLSATSRADLEIYNPFLNEDGNETIDPSSAVIYQVIDGDLFDVTSSFEYKEGDNGDMAFVTRTRFLGTYIICERAVEEAMDNNEVPDTDLVPDDTTPSEVTPDNNNGGKAPANTGKYL